MERAENHENPYASCEQQTRWEIPIIMNKTIRFVFYTLLTFGLFAFSSPTFRASGQNAAPNQTLTPEQQASKLKEKWDKVFSDAQRNFQNNNDRDSSEFIGKILDSLDQPGGFSPSAQEADRERINRQVRELVRNGALDSAAILQETLYHVIPLHGNNATGPVQPNNKTGGTPGPGGLVLYLPFDKHDENGIVQDESGAGNDGRVFGAKWVSEGKFGGAYRFQITNLTDRIVIPNSDTLNPDNITLSAWIKAADRDGFWNRIMDKDYRNAYCLDLGGDFNGKGARGKLQFETSAGAMGSDRALDDDQWHHIAATYDGKTLRCYIDGVEKSRPVKNPGPLKKTGWDLCIGNSVVDYGTDEFLAYDGLIDEVRIYNHALSAAEIKALASATHAGVDVLPPPADATPKPDAAERLKKVKALYDEGLINKEDYDKKVNEIMDSL